MKKLIVILILFVFPNINNAQCISPVNTYSDNINYYNVQVNWSSAPNSHRYKIRYKETSSVSGWSFINNIASSLNNRIISNLVPLSEYVWQIRNYCDSTNTNFSNWSVADTFTTITSNCPNADSLYATNINYNNALANWSSVLGANRYKVRYKVLGANAWSNLAAVYHPTTSITIPLLQQNTTYEWQVCTFQDSTILMSSLWSISDTFTTSSFVAAPFNPVINNTLSTLECNARANLYLEITQSSNEPDIGSGTISSDAGYFDLLPFSIGDSVGYASMTTATQTINSVLRIGIILNQNYAIINSYDSLGYLIGFFTIENENGGVKVQLPGSPNDGNNYTSGYVSDIYFNDLFVNPQNAGPLHFFGDIDSELNDQVYTSDTVQIWCNTMGLNNFTEEKQITHLYNVLGKNTEPDRNSVRIIRFSDGSVKKYILLKK